jgi:hypothetical protein
MLPLKVVGEDGPLNETAEIERRDLEEERRTFPRYTKYRFLRGVRVSLRGSCTSWSGSR